MLYRGLDADEHGAYVHSHGAVEIIEAKDVDGSDHRDAGVVDERVDRSEFAFGDVGDASVDQREFS